MDSLSSSVAAVKEDCGGSTLIFCAICGIPSSPRKDTTASPTPKFKMVVLVSKDGFSRKASAAAFTAFCSAGV